MIVACRQAVILANDSLNVGIAGYLLVEINDVVGEQVLCTYAIQTQVMIITVNHIRANAFALLIRVHLREQNAETHIR